MRYLRFANILFSLIALLSGLLIYLTFRDNTYIHSFLPDYISEFFYIEDSEQKNSIILDFIKYYFADFLWGISFSSALIAVIYSYEVKLIVIYSAISFFIGLIFEFCQHSGFIGGTFDYADICMYFAASVLVAVINIKIIKRSKL